MHGVRKNITEPLEFLRGFQKVLGSVENLSNIYFQLCDKAIFSTIAYLRQRFNGFCSTWLVGAMKHFAGGGHKFTYATESKIM